MVAIDMLLINFVVLFQKTNEEKAVLFVPLSGHHTNGNGRYDSEIDSHWGCSRAA